MNGRNYPDLNIYDVHYIIFKDSPDGPLEEEMIIGVLAPDITAIETYLKELHLPDTIRIEKIGYGNSGEVFHVISGIGKQVWE